ncbi:MAG: hypothetical protein WBQ94_08690 [Terracidiphilus sp.]
MSELYHHLLIPRDPEFAPGIETVPNFFNELNLIGALPKEANYVVVTHTGKTRPFGRNPNTGEEYLAPELKIGRFSTLLEAIDSMRGEAIYSLIAQAIGPAAIPPFDLYSADSYKDRRPGVLWKEPYEFSIQCRQRDKITHFLHSPFGCKCEIKPDDSGIFENPWTDQEIRTSGLACARFWIDIGIGNYLIPMMTNSVDILNPRLVNTADDVFGIEFTQGCFRNDD